MTYLVLARKWRPRSFETLVGQDHVVRALTHALSTQRLHHAWLFTGTRGVGKTTLSRILAKSLNCEIGITATPCGVCRACTEIDAGRFVDYVELDAASNRGVDEMTQLLEQAVYAPGSGRFKVYMIDEVHMLTGHAFNAMLKTLEEPPPHVKFILATTDPQKIPVTVLSRCLQFNLKQMTGESIVTHLHGILQQEDVPFEIPALRLLAQAASGSMRDALSLTDQAIAYSAGNLSADAVQGMLGTIDQRHLVVLIKALAEGSATQVLQVADELASRGLSYSGALADMAILLSRIAIEQRVPGAASVDDPLAEDIASLAGLLHPDQVQLFYSVAVHSRQELSLAPDEYAGFVMACLRMLALVPPGLPPSTGGGAPQAKNQQAPSGSTAGTATEPAAESSQAARASSAAASTASAAAPHATSTTAASQPSPAPAATSPVSRPVAPTTAPPSGTPSSPAPAASAPVSRLVTPTPASPSGTPSSAATHAAGLAQQTALSAGSADVAPADAPVSQPQADALSAKAVAAPAASGSNRHGAQEESLQPVSVADSGLAHADAHADIPAWEDMPAASVSGQNGHVEQPDRNVPQATERVNVPASGPMPDDGFASSADGYASTADGFETMQSPEDDYFDDARFEPDDFGEAEANDIPGGAVLSDESGQEILTSAFKTGRSKKGKQTRLRDMTAQSWPALAAQLPVTGLAAELAKQSEWLGAKGDEVRLRVAVRTLAESQGRARLCTVLTEHFGTVVRLEVEYGATGDETARAVEKAHLATLQREAEEAVVNDPLVQALIAEFGAMVVPDSIRAAPEQKAA